MKSFLDKFRNAFRGLLLGMLDRSIRLQLALMVVAIGVGCFLSFSVIEWCLLLVCCLVVISLEFVNTVFEKVLDFVHPDYHHKIKDIKDMGAGFVLFAALMALTIGVLLALSKLL